MKDIQKTYQQLLLPSDDLVADMAKLDGNILIQAEEIDRIYKNYPQFTNDDFVKQFLLDDQKPIMNLQLSKQHICY